MESVIFILRLFLSRSIQHKLRFVGGCVGLIYILRWFLSRNIPSLPEGFPKPSTNTTFLKQLFKLLPIAIPSYSSKEAVYTYTLSLILIIRSLLNIFISSLNGKIIKAVVTNNKQAFFRRVISI